MKDEKEDQAQDTPSIVTGNSTGEYEYSAPVVYDGSSAGEYEFGILQDKKTGELSREVTLTPDDDEDVGSTLLMDKPNIEKTVTPEEAARAEHEKLRAQIKERFENPPLKLVALSLVMAVALMGMGFFIFVATKQESAIAVNEPMPEGTADIPTLSKPKSQIEVAPGAPGSLSQKVVYALGYAPYTAAPSGGLKYKSHVTPFHGFGEEVLSGLEALNCTEISLEGKKVSDNSLQKLSKLKNIYMLDLQNAHGFSPKGLFVFKETTLKRLHLDGTGISDEWMPVLESLPVEFLSVMGNKLSEESLITLAKSKTLKFVKFEADPSRKINDTFNTAGWIRLPEGNERAFNYYRETLNAQTH